MSDGIRLQNLFKRHAVDVETVAKNAKLTPRSIYRYQTQDTIKPGTINKLLLAAGIDKAEWDTYFLKKGKGNELKETPAEYFTSGNYHQGMNLHKLLQVRGINTTAFADTLNVARTTLYRYFDEKELPEPILMQAADKLGVKVTEIKGLGNTTASFEKDIYLTLQQMAQSLKRIENHLQLSV